MLKGVNKYYQKFHPCVLCSIINFEDYNVLLSIIKLEDENMYKHKYLKYKNKYLKYKNKYSYTENI